MDSVLQAYQKNLPGLSNSITSQILPTEQAQLEAQQKLSPQQNQLQLDTYAKYAPQFSAVGQQIVGQDQAMQAQNNINALKQSGGALGEVEQNIDRGLNPEWYKQREQSATNLTNLFNSLQDPNAGATASDQAEIARGLAQQNNASGVLAPNATTAAAAGMAFGQQGEALRKQRQEAIQGALGTAQGVMAGDRSPNVNPIGTITGQPVTNFGGAQNPNQTAAVGGMASNIGDQMFAATNNMQMQRNQIDANRPSGLQQMTSIAGSLPSCCFIFLEAYNGQIPWYVRCSRDMHMTPANRRGYIWMSKWLVPAMKRSSVVRTLTNFFMIKPLTKDAAFMCKVDNTERKVARKFWLGLWEILGRVTGTAISYKTCKGRQWTWGKWQLEYWSIPPMFSVPLHTHSNFTSRIIPVGGDAVIGAGGKWDIVTFGRWYKVPENVPHAVDAFSGGFRFINIQHWKTKPTSASVDFNLV